MCGTVIGGSERFQTFCTMRMTPAMIGGKNSAIFTVTTVVMSVAGRTSGRRSANMSITTRAFAPASANCFDISDAV